MARLLSCKPERGAPGRRGAAAWTIRGKRYTNAAAKFWSTIVDEMRRDYPQCPTLELVSLSPGTLTPDLLHPLKSLERDLNDLMFCDIETVMKETIAELELIGPPSGVRMRLLSGEVEIASGQLPLDCVDAEIFPYLLAWLLSWAQLPEKTWNTEHLKGTLAAEDRRRRITHDISFILTTNHISEGLFQRCLSLSSSTTFSK